MATPTNYFTQKNANIFNCECCDFICSKQSDMARHLGTRKHARLINANAGLTDFTPEQFDCICGNKYKHMPSLCKHKKICKEIKKQNIINGIVTGSDNEVDELDKVDFLKNENKEILNMLKHQINENTEFRKQIVDIVSKQNETINTLASKAGNHITNNNKTFNLNVFLNETCKGAINMTDFVNSIQLQLSDLETTGQLGYVQGITKIFLNNLNGLNTHDRPIHCSDFKREILYIKDNNEWTKEEENKLILQKAIKEVASKNIKQIPEWVKTHPDCCDSDSKQNDKYLKIVSNAMSGGSKEEQLKNIQLIIKNLAKEVVIEKNSLI